MVVRGDAYSRGVCDQVYARDLVQEVNPVNLKSTLISVKKHRSTNQHNNKIA